MKINGIGQNTMNNWLEEAGSISPQVSWNIGIKN